MAISKVIEVVQGDQLPEVSFLVEDEDTGEPTDLSDATVRAIFDVPLAYEGETRRQQIPLAKVGTGTNGLLRLTFAGGQLDGVDAGDYPAALRVFFGGSRISFLGFRVRVQEDLLSV